ncbi:MAG: proline iminopeptidase-family hydrolase [Verrucomicrobia bacterium]|nr:proline iminopeptidase-family hydrolase [Verrucomicrobiota bacterium]
MPMKKLLLFLLLFGAAFANTFKTSDGSCLYYCVKGEGNPLIVVHGGPGLSQKYLSELEALSDTVQVIFYDQRGSGLSEGPIDEEHIYLERFVEDLEELRSHLGLEKISILGHSWGGYLAMNYAIAHPESVDRLILLNSMTATFPELLTFLEEYERRTGPFQIAIDEITHSASYAAGDSEAVAKHFRIVYRTYCKNPADAERLDLISLPQSNLNGIKTSEIMIKSCLLNPFDLREELKKLPCKTLIVHGDFDPIPLDAARTIKNSIPDSTLHVIENCGHFPHVEKPDETFLSLKQFLIP